MSAANPCAGGPYLQFFKLYETRSKFYLIGSDKSTSVWRVLKIDRSEPNELNLWEDPVMYTEIDCRDLLMRIHEGNRSTGGLKFITICYGIIGFVKFLGPYYMLLVTQRRKIGDICGHEVYAISKSEMLEITDSTTRSSMVYPKDEKRANCQSNTAFVPRHASCSPEVHKCTPCTCYQS